MLLWKIRYPKIFLTKIMYIWNFFVSFLRFLGHIQLQLKFFEKSIETGSLPNYGQDGCQDPRVNG